MSKHSLSTLALCLAFGLASFSCTDSSGGYFDADPSAANDSINGGGAPLGGAGGPASESTPAPSLADPAGGNPSPPPEPVPEPMTMLLFGSGLAGVAYRYRRKKGDETDVADPETQIL